MVNWVSDEIFLSVRSEMYRCSSVETIQDVKRVTTNIVNMFWVFCQWHSPFTPQWALKVGLSFTFYTFLLWVSLVWDSLVHTYVMDFTTYCQTEPALWNFPKILPECELPHRKLCLWQITSMAQYIHTAVDPFFDGKLIMTQFLEHIGPFSLMFPVELQSQSPQYKNQD